MPNDRTLEDFIKDFFDAVSKNTPKPKYKNFTKSTATPWSEKINYAPNYDGRKQALANHPIPRQYKSDERLNKERYDQSYKNTLRGN